METKFTESDIQRLLVQRYIGGGCRRNLCVPNVSWGFFHSHEADLVCVTKSGYMTEYEIKRTWNDFLADFKKHTNHFENKVLCMYYVVPVEIAERCLEFMQQYEWKMPYGEGLFDRQQMQIPVGLITYDQYGIFKRRLYAPNLNTYTQKPMQAFKLTQDQIHNLARLGVMRLWT